MKNLGQSVENPCIYAKDNIVYKANNKFLQSVDFKDDDIVGKSLMDLNKLLRSEFQSGIQDIIETSHLYIFKSDDSPLKVKISCETLNNENNKAYYFEMEADQALKFMLHNFEDTYTTQNEAVAIFSYPYCILNWMN